MAGTAPGGKGEQRDPRADTEEMAGGLGGGDGDVGELFNRGFGNNAAIRQEQDAVLAEAGVFDFHDQATGGGGGLGGDLDDLEQRPQHAARRSG